MYCMIKNCSSRIKVGPSGETEWSCYDTEKMKSAGDILLCFGMNIYNSQGIPSSGRRVLMIHTVVWCQVNILVGCYITAPFGVNVRRAAGSKCFDLTVILNSPATDVGEPSGWGVFFCCVSAAGGWGGTICAGGHLRAKHRQHGCSLLWHFVSGQLWQWRPSTPQTAWKNTPHSLLFCLPCIMQMIFNYTSCLSLKM